MRACRLSAPRRRRGALALATVLLLAAGPVRADTQDAATLEKQLHDWLAAVLGPRVKLGDRPIQLTPQDDHFALAVPVSGALGDSGVTLDGPPFTATLHRLDDGRWALDNGRLPSPLHITTTLPKGPAEWTTTLEDQDQHAAIDPTLSATSTWDGSVGHSLTVWHGPDGERRSEASQVRTHVAVQPAGDGRVNVSETATSELVASNAKMDKLGVTSFSAGRTLFTSHVDRLAPDRLPALLQALFDLAPMAADAAKETTATGQAPKTKMTPQARADLERFLDAVDDLLVGFGERVHFENVHAHSGNYDVAMKALDAGSSAAAPEGRLRLQIHLAVDGFDSGALPEGKLREYVPHHFVLTQSIGGVSAAETMALLRHAVASNGDDAALTDEGDALLRHGPLAVRIDELSSDFGPAKLSASGEVNVAGSDTYTGRARIRVTGLDAVIADAQDDPMLKQSLPFLIVLKGIGQAEGEATVWHVLYDGKRLTVNGNDLSQMLGGKK